jgi:hypothetical protein
VVVVVWKILKKMSMSAADIVHKYLESYQYDNALTLASIIYHDCPCEELLALLANTHIRRGEFEEAHELMKGSCTQPKTRYLRAYCCIHLNKYQEAEDILLERNSTGTKFGVPNGACGLHLLGVICRKTQRVEEAIKYFQMSFQADPLMYESFTALCDLGATNAMDTLGPMVGIGAAASSLAGAATSNQYHQPTQGQPSPSPFHMNHAPSPVPSTTTQKATVAPPPPPSSSAHSHLGTPAGGATPLSSSMASLELDSSLKQPLNFGTPMTDTTPQRFTSTPQQINQPRTVSYTNNGNNSQRMIDSTCPTTNDQPIMSAFYNGNSVTSSAGSHNPMVKTRDK